MFKIDAVRFGHACNSSSTHSFIIPDQEVETDELADFGWQYFTVASGNIDNYLAATISSGISYNATDAVKQSILDKVNRHLELSLELDEFEDMSVDHQSLIRIPSSFHNPDEPDWEYVKDLRRWFKKHNVAVLGGNDNEETSHHLSDAGRTVDIPGLVDFEKITCRYSGSQWVLFNRSNGYRVRIRFDDRIPERPTSPELVDIKITDYCESNCGYCYQGSTTKGEHASFNSIINVLNELSALKVFEVAIGGGEPTTHPNFKEIVEYAQLHGIVPNVTTRNYNFVRDNYEWCAKHLGTIAVSVDSPVGVHRVRALRTLSDGTIKFNVQVVAGGVYDFDGLVAAAGEAVAGTGSSRGLPITLLGFKEQERGAGYPKRSYKNWRELMLKHYKHGFNVDTAFLQLHKEELDEIVGSRASKFYTLNEGIYSCYIDAVKMEIAPSSYCDRRQYQSLYSEPDATIATRWAALLPESEDRNVVKGQGFEMASLGSRYDFGF